MYICQHCGKEYQTNSNLQKHLKYVHGNNTKKELKSICKYCGKECFASGLSKHENFCALNPNRKIRKSNPWNKGLTKETNETIRRKAKEASDKIRKNGHVGCFGLKGSDNPACRPEVKKKVSEKMLGNHNNNPNKTGRGKKGWYKGFYCSSTYELAFVIYCLDHNIKLERFKGYYTYQYNGKDHRYYPDFIIDDCIYEIKGFFSNQVKAKTEAVKDRPIKVLYRNDLSEVFEYVLSKYGKKVDKNIHELYE